MVNSVGSFHPYYIGEAAIFSVVAWVLCGIYVLQLYLEQRHQKKLGRVHHTFHVCGVLSAVTLILTAIDPQGVFGIFRWEILTIIKDSTVAIAYVPLSLWTTSLIIIIGEQKGDYGFRLSRHLEHNYKKYCAGASALNLIILVITDTISILSNNTFARACWLLFLAISSFFAAILLMHTIYSFHKIHNQTNDKVFHFAAQGCFSEYGYFSPKTRKIRNTALVLLFMAVMELQNAISFFFHPIAFSVDQVPQDRTQIKVFYWILPYWLGMIAGLYGSWLPVSKTDALPSTTAPHSPSSKPSSVER
jgi:hypothetical protein